MNVDLYPGALDAYSPPAGATVTMHPGVYRVPSGGTRGLSITEPGVAILAHGATIMMDNTQSSHGLAIFASDTTVEGLRVIGAGNTGDDCIYIGGSPEINSVPERVSLIDCVADGNGVARNALSIVAGRDVLVQGGEYCRAGGSPGMGIDVEANRYMADLTNPARGIHIVGAAIHSNLNGGVGVIFGEDVEVRGCQIWGNGTGVSASVGGEQFADTVYRPGDILGVGGYDAVDGWVAVGDISAYDIDVGMMVTKTARNGGAWPPEFDQNYYMVAEIDETQTKVKLAHSSGVELVIPSTEGIGALSTDPEVADLRLMVTGRAGNTGDVRVIENTFWGNADEDVNMSTGRGFAIKGNTLYSENFGIVGKYAMDGLVKGNTLTGGAGRGISVGGGGGWRTDGNVVTGYALEGIRVSGRFAMFERDQVSGSGGYNFRLDNAHETIVADITCEGELALISKVTDCVVKGAKAHTLTGGARASWLHCEEVG